MPAPLVGIAIATAAKMAAKKLATKAVKKKALSNTFGAKGTIKKQVTLKKKAAVKVGPKNSVKVIKPGTKPLTKPDVPYSAKVPRSPAELKRMGL